MLLSILSRQFVPPSFVCQPQPSGPVRPSLDVRPAAARAREGTTRNDEKIGSLVERCHLNLRLDCLLTYLLSAATVDY
jgi:hypothetical protein